jgi:hypothetical protein
MNITYECVASVTMLFVLGNLLFGFRPALLPIRRGDETLRRRSREIHRDATHFLS